VTAQSRPVSKSDAKWLMERDMRAALQTVEHDVVKPLNSVQEGALVDFVYNVGSGNFASSTLLRNLNAGRYDLAAAQFDVWNKGGGRVLEGLVRRRAAEHALFLQTPK
jgi:lysozyme